MSLKEKDIQFLEDFYTPIRLLEVLFHDFDNFGQYKKGKFGEVRFYQFPMISDESLIDFELTAQYHKMDKKQEFRMKNVVGDIYCFGARKF